MSRIYVSEPSHFYTYELPVTPGAEVYVGTSPNCQLCLPGVDGLAEVHACIVCQGQEYMISDLGSPQGTFANGTPVRSVFLMPGIEYRLGAVVITLAVEGAPPPQPQYPQQPHPMMPPMQQAPQAPPMMQPWGMPQQPMQPPYPQAGAQAPMGEVAAPSAEQPASSHSAAPRAKMRHLSMDELDALRSRFLQVRSSGFPWFKIIFFILALLTVAFFANMLPIHRDEAKDILNALFRDMDTPAGKRHR